MKIHFNKPYMKVTFQLTIRETMEIIIHTHIHIYVSTYIYIYTQKMLTLNIINIGTRNVRIEFAKLKHTLSTHYRETPLFPEL